MSPEHTEDDLSACDDTPDCRCRCCSDVRAAERARVVSFGYQALQEMSEVRKQERAKGWKDEALRTGDQMAGLREFCQAIERGEHLQGEFSV